MYHKRDVEQKASGRRRAFWIITAVAITVGIVVLVAKSPRFRRKASLTGAILVANVDPRKQVPIPNVDITAQAGDTTAQAKSDPTGFFRLIWPARVWPGEQITLKFRHAGYEPVEITQRLSDELQIVRMTPVSSENTATLKKTADAPATPVAHIRVRYSVKATTTIEVGSTAKTFEVESTGNIPCDRRSPCSPDGKWKASIGSITLKAGEGQEFRNVRVSCIAGPCPFTKLESDEYLRGGPTINVSVRAWSDTVTFLVEAEVVRTMISDAIRQAYPSIFGSDMTFTLPSTGQGPSIEAEVNGTEIVFPLGPDLRLSWATCTVQVSANETKLYSCKLKDGYRFR